MTNHNRPASGARRRWLWLVVALAALTGCRGANPTPPPGLALPVPPPATQPPPASLPTPTGAAPQAAAPTATPDPTPVPTPLPTRTPLVIANPSAACGVLLPPLVADSAEPTTWRPPLIADGVVPDDALPAVTRLLTQPDSAALVVYRLGYEGIGFYHNAERALPLASVVKLVHLVAYAEAVAAGRLNPDEAVPLAELERYYLPRSDLGAHSTALADLRADGRLLDDNRAVRLGDIVWMMVRHSANSATDYLHYRLGQTAIEQTVRDLDLGPHSAPCPFLGQFLTMTNHTRLAADAVVLRELIADPARYAAEATTLADGYVQSADVRSAESATWGRRQHPSIATQRLFTAELSPRGTAGGYADLMAGIVRGSVGSPAANAVIRSYLEWPLDAFPTNAARYAVIGYKNGTLPGVLNTVYYAWPTWSDQPLVVALFFRDLPQDVYQQWRRTLPHDALAHWLMSDPNAIHVLHVLRDHIE